MKHITNENYGKIQKALSVAFSEEEHVEISANWRLKLMGRIRGLEPRPNISYVELFQQLVWKLSPVTIAMLIIFLMAIAQADFTSNHEIATFLMEDPIEYSLFAPMVPAL